MINIDSLCKQTTNAEMLNALHACRPNHPLNHPMAWQNAYCLASQRTLDFSGADIHWLQQKAS